MKTLLALLLLIPSLSFADNHPEKDTSLHCLKYPHEVKEGDYPIVGGHAWWFKISGGENYNSLKAFRIQMTGRGPELNRLDTYYEYNDLNIWFHLPNGLNNTFHMLDRVELELESKGRPDIIHLCIIIDDAYTEAKGAHTRLLELYLKDQAKLKSERKL